MTPHMIVDDVADEYRFVRAIECVTCGFKGSYEVGMQRLVHIEGKPHDILECKCKECSTERTFTFDVSNVFAKYDEMFKKRDDGE